MKKSNIDIILNNRMIKLIGYAFITVFLGAIGSGLWERLLSKWFEFASTGILSLFSRTFRGYVNVLHYSIGRAQTDTFTHGPYIIFVMALILFPWILLYIFNDKINSLIILYKNEPEDNNIKDNIDVFIKNIKRKIYVVAIPIAIFGTLSIFHSALRDIYTRNACIFVEQSIDILSPKISNEKVLELKAMYRSVDDAKKFYALEDKLRYLARNSNIALPSFTTIR